MSEVQKAVVTVASRLIGSQLVEYLMARGSEAVAIEQVSADPPGARVQLDTCRDGGISTWLGPETTVYHMAASANVRSAH